jgi:hypothetical protein
LKVEAYSRVISALYHAKEYEKRLLESELNETVLSEEKKEELIKNARISRDEIDKTIDIGRLLMSSEAVNMLKDYRKNSCDCDGSDWWLYLESVIETTDACIGHLIEIAKRDLKLEP